ncbi:hypothetical protein EST38_g10292 [Candolleomyces aberdarensis]|uniref:WW domain-containing protein n=1 Tax=Candolleomyces aberdarensis TaxID=2316362 RepID=A0A4Q2DAM7_9AGAR|nr:hypothetical protein EST38_g10292 [Candolleomyces aberdarensis]
MSDRSQTPSREESPEANDSPEPSHTATESSEQPAASQTPRTEEENEDAKDEKPTPAEDSSAQQQHAWQAIFSPQHNAYYFFNSVTQETTWVNPLQGSEATASSSTQPQDPSSSSSSKSNSKSRSTSPAPEADAASSSTATNAAAGPGPTSHYTALQAAAMAQGIDPALAHLDPSLLGRIPGQQTDSSGIPMFTAKFNRHTGTFARADARDPSHLSESERAKRMSQVYFDVDAWEKDLASRGGSIKNSDPYATGGGSGSGAGAGDEWEDDGEGGRKRKRPTKKDLERFKEQKRQKKLAKTAWLRS